MMIDYANLSDTDLLRLISQGDRLAENELTGRYTALVELCARPYYLAGGDRRDLIQEGMFGLIAAMRSYSEAEGVSFRAYAGLCIRSRLLSAIRSASRLKHLPLNEGISFEQLSEDPTAYASVIPSVSGLNPEDLVLARESKEELYGVLTRTLSQMERSVLELYLQGLSYEEIALRLDKSVKSIDNAVQRIRKKLARNPIPGEISPGLIANTAETAQDQREDSKCTKTRP